MGRIVEIQFGPPACKKACWRTARSSSRSIAAAAANGLRAKGLGIPGLWARGP